MTLEVKKLRDPWVALGLAAHFLAKRPPFAGFAAEALIRTLDAQVRRGHYLLAFEVEGRQARVSGYLGWVLLDHATAERMARTGELPSVELEQGGDVAWVLTAASESRKAFQALLAEARALYPQHRVMAVRHKQGRRVLFDRPPPGRRGRS